MFIIALLVESLGEIKDNEDIVISKLKKKHFLEKMSPQIVANVEEKLKLQWSPTQISGWLKRHGKEHVSDETIYNHIWKDKRQVGQLYKELRHQGKKYNKERKGTSGRGSISGRIDIKQRPSIVAKRLV